MRIIAIINHKGGVGKTTTTHNLGKALSLLGKKVLLIDIDPQANLSVACGVENPEKSIANSLLDNDALSVINVDENLNLVPATLELSEVEFKIQTNVTGTHKLKKALSKVKDFDFVLIDCPPSLGILTTNALMACSEVIIVMQPQYFSVLGLKTIKTLITTLQEDLGINIKITGILATQTNNTIISKNFVQDLAEASGEKVFETTIRQTVTFQEASALQKDVFAYAAESKASEDYLNLAKELL